jgi:crotonobetaine/carnitine-CoA ligase
MSGASTIADLTALRAAREPERPIVRLEQETLTYRDLEAMGERVAGALHAAGIGPGHTVATMLGTRPEALGLWIGIVRAGAVEVPVNPALKAELLREVLSGSGCRLIVVEQPYAAAVDEVVDLRNAKVVVIGGRGPRGYEAFLAGATDAPDHEADPLDVSLVLYTSGTTGPSKGVELSHTANFGLARSIVDYAGITEDDVLFTAFPLFHVAARCVSVLAAMLADAEVVVHSRFSATRFWDTCRKEGITAIHYLGSVPMMLWKQPATGTDADNPVRVAYGAGMPQAVWEAFEGRFGLEIFELYGSTEQSVTAMNRGRERRVGSCGRPADYVELEIHDPNDDPLPPGTPGEIVVRPREPGIFFAGYRGMPEATVAAWRNLWFHTGDQGYLDDDGYLYFMGRLKDAIRRRGENISAWEVERALLAMPGIAEAAAIGVPSDLGEEELLVAVVPEEGAMLDPADVVDHCARLLPAHAVPRYVALEARLPKTPSDRVKKYELRSRGVTPQTYDRDRAAAGTQKEVR